jgi:prepilin-type N-terminal cleavage/methylation domain-containing protein
MSRAGSQAGFSLVELLLASAVTLIVVGGALGLIGPAQRIFQAQPEASDVQQRVRVGIETLRRDLLMAGAGPYAGLAGGPLNSFIAPVMPYLAFGAATDPARGVYFRRDAISFLYVPSTASQTRLVTPLLPGAVDVELEPLANCPPPTPTAICGFAAGDRVLLLDAAGTSSKFA